MARYLVRAEDKLNPDNASMLIEWDTLNKALESFHDFVLQFPHDRVEMHDQKTQQRICVYDPGGIPTSNSRDE